MRDYTQLTQEERSQIEALLKVGHRQSKIATVLKRHKSTISREVGCNRGLHGYRPKQAQGLALARREAQGPKPRIAPGTWERLRACCARSGVRSKSAGWLSGEQGLHVSHEWIYSMFMQTSARAATFIPTGVARSSAGSTTGAMTAGARSGVGLQSTSGRGLLRNAPASETGRLTQ